jgi:hypothetical protein
MDDRRALRTVSGVPMTWHARAVGERDVVVALSGAARAARAYLESQPAAGPVDRIPLIALPPRPGQREREYRASLPVSAPREREYVPVAVFGGDEVRGDAFRVGDLTAERPSAAEPRAATAPTTLPVMELIAHAEAELPNMTVFGPTPEGIRIAFYIHSGKWTGPRIHARYKSEGGDWLLIREDGVGIPNARATLETVDGALLYYQLTGTIELGPDGYARTLANNLPEFAPFSAVAQLSTSSEHWAWLNRLTLVGTGVVDLKRGRVVYDLYSITCSPAFIAAFAASPSAR